MMCFIDDEHVFILDGDNLLLSDNYRQKTTKTDKGKCTLFSTQLNSW